ncbi:MAG TPA: hypothetical protein VI913_05370 [Candidatus Peribacteraceae bacterium]|nr:hypothetical protein [Candidatus Peribacteraceae bacterium]
MARATTLRFTTLLSAAAKNIQRAWPAVLTGIVAFALLMNVVSQFVGRQIASQEANLWHGLGRDPAQVEELLQRARDGDEEAFNELMQLQDAFLQELEDMPQEERDQLAAQQTIEMFTTLLPLLALLFVVQMLVMLLSFHFYFVQAVSEVTTPVEVWRNLRTHLLPLIGVSLWIVIRTFSWLPFIGPLFALLLGPRFVLAPVILLQEKKGIMASARLSYERTRGHWWSITSQAILMTLAVMIGTFVIFGVLQQMIFLPPFTLGLLVAMTWQLGLVLMTGFIVKLALTFIGLPLISSPKLRAP